MPGVAEYYLVLQMLSLYKASREELTTHKDCW